MKTKILVAALAASFVAIPAAHAKVEISGQVNVAAIDGGGLEDFAVVDNNTTGSRFRIKASKKFGNGFTVGTRYELQAQFAQSNQAGEIGNNSGAANNAVREVRYADVWVQGNFGRIGIGRGDGAADSTGEAYGLLNYLGGAEAYLLFAGAGAGFSAVDGVSRQNRIRYDSPNFSGFKFAVSLDEQDAQEVAAWYNGKVAGGDLSVALGVVDGSPGGEVDTTDFSIAYKFGFGLGLAYVASEVEDNASGATLTEVEWVQVSYDIGKHWVVSAGFGEEDGGDQDDELNIFSVVWKPVKGTEIYLNYGDWDNGSLAGNGINAVEPNANQLAQTQNPDDNAIGLGARFKF